MPNMDRMPILEIDDKYRIGQSKVIERYLAEKCSLMGSNSEERAIIECIVENIRDIKDKWSKIRMIGGFESNPEKEKAIDKWFVGGEFAEWLTKLENSLPEQIQLEYSVGNKDSYSDIAIWHLLRDTFEQSNLVLESELQAKCVRLSSIANRISANPQLSNYISNRPKTIF